MGLTAMMMNQCGVEIGNPKDEDPSPTKYAESDVNQSLELSQITVDEALQAVASSSLSESSLSDSLAFANQLALQNTITCTENTDGSINTAIKFSNSLEAIRGRNQDRRITIDIDHDVNRQLSSADSDLRCISSESRPILPWRRLNSLDITSDFTRSSSQVVNKVSSGETLARRQRTSNGERRQNITKISSDADFIVLEEVLTFEVSHTSTITKGDETTLYESQISIDEEQPLIVERKLSRDRNQNTILIKSGTITTLNSAEATVVLTYNNLMLDPVSCRIQDGEITGSLRLNNSDSINQLNFTIGLFEGEERIRFADGTERSVDLNPCALQ
jgi:hypothetical protein